jgi:hypothetical protein
MTRLLALSPSRFLSGAETVLVRTLTAASDRGWEVRCACAAGPLADELGRRRVPREPIPDLKLPAGPALLALPQWAGRTAVAAAALRRLARSSDIVLVNGFLGLPALRLSRIDVP